MINFKSLVISVIAVFLMVPAIFADGEIITKSPYGDYVYETTMKALVDKGVSDEIKLVNKSSYPLKFISCTVRINGRDHDMRAIPLLRIGVSENFDGFFKDDMTREFSKFFGKDGRITYKNNNYVKFTFKFMDHDSDVAITDVYAEDKDLCFVVSNIADTNAVAEEKPVEAANSTVNSAVTDEQLAAEPKTRSDFVQAKTKAKVSKQEPKTEPEQTEEKIPGTNISEQTPAPIPAATTDDTIVVIEGKTYLLHDGKAYVVQ